MKEHEAQDNDIAPSGSRSLVPKKVIYVVIVLCLILISITNYITYSWQRKQVLWQLKQRTISQAQLTAARASISKNEDLLKVDAKQLTDETQKYSAINQQYQALLNAQQQAPPTQADLQLTVGKATIYSNGCCAQIGIVVTLKNTTSSSILIQPDAYTLKDAGNHTFMFDSNLMTQFLGSDYTPLLGQSLAPGETVTGALGYDIPDKSVTNYTLLLGPISYKVTATQK